MSSSLTRFIKKTAVGAEHNLVSLEEPYDIMRRLLNDHEIHAVLDAGASNARISKRFLSLYPEAQVHAFEPNRSMYQAQLEHLALQEPRFHPHFLALSNDIGESDLHIAKSPGASSLLAQSDRLAVHGFDNTSVDRTEKVRLTTIDRWAGEHAPQGVQLMKFDIQGAELQALQGASRVLGESVLLVYAEIWFNPVYANSATFADIDALLRGHGYLLYDLYKPRYSSRGMLLWANALFAHGGRLGMI